MFPVPADRRGKIESQIKQGINRIYNEYKKGPDDKGADKSGDQDEGSGEFDEFETPADDEIEAADGGEFVEGDGEAEEYLDGDLESDLETDVKMPQFDDEPFDEVEDSDE
jgi:hypothetical protein